MACLNTFQFLGKSFHTYFERFRELLGKHSLLGIWYDEQDAFMILIK